MAEFLLIFRYFTQISFHVKLLLHLCRKYQEEKEIEKIFLREKLEKFVVICQSFNTKTEKFSIKISNFFINFHSSSSFYRIWFYFVSLPLLYRSNRIYRQIVLFHWVFDSITTTLDASEENIVTFSFNHHFPSSKEKREWEREKEKRNGKTT